MLVQVYYIKNPDSLKEFVDSVRGRAILHVGERARFDLKRDNAGFEVLRRLRSGAEDVRIGFSEKADRDRFVQYLISA